MDRPTGLIGADDLPPARVAALLDLARMMRETPGACAGLLRGTTVALAFLEPSTRTRVSFELAAGRMGATVIHLGADSSLAKGESLADTIRTIAELGTDGLVLRHPREGAAQIARDAGLPTINAGDGTHEHPTQALADLLVLHDHLGADLAMAKVAFMGDVLHSRVARSLIPLLQAQGVQVRVAGPRTLMPAMADPSMTLASRADVLRWADVIYVLRPQRERGAFDGLREGDYIRDWRLGYVHLGTDQVVLHAGPVLTGLDLGAGMADDPRLLASDQVRAGLWVRIATLAWLLADAR